MHESKHAIETPSDLQEDQPFNYLLPEQRLDLIADMLSELAVRVAKKQTKQE